MKNFIDIIKKYLGWYIAAIIIYFISFAIMDEILIPVYVFIGKVLFFPINVVLVLFGVENLLIPGFPEYR